MRPGVLMFAGRLKAAREAAGYSQRGLGIALGFDPSAASPRINQYERGRREPDLETASRMAALLKVPLAYLYCEEDDIATALLGLARLSAPARAEVIDLILQAERGPPAK
jgi:transcriptional regulator with XRE-family HTH domain